VRASMRHSRNAPERKKRNTPLKPHAAANQIATLAEATATNNETSIGPAMNIVSISTESSEYAVVSKGSSPKRWRKNVRTQTVIGGKLAPAAAAQSATVSEEAPFHTAATSAMSHAGKRTALVMRTAQGPQRSMIRPSAGATKASPATKQPVAAPPVANDPLVPCTKSKIDSPLIPIGKRPMMEAAKR